MEPTLANENTKRSTSKSALLALIGLGFILAVVGLFYAPSEDPGTGPLVGLETPDFEFELPSGERRTLASYRGKVVLVNFWAYWCGPCLEEMDSLKKLETHFEGKDFVLLMAHVGDEKDEVAKLAGLPSQILMDVPAGALASFGVSGLPHSILIDKQGVVRGEFKGPRDWMSSEILPLITEPLG